MLSILSTSLYQHHEQKHHHSCLRYYLYHQRHHQFTSTSTIITINHRYEHIMVSSQEVALTAGLSIEVLQDYFCTTGNWTRILIFYESDDVGNYGNNNDAVHQGFPRSLLHNRRLDKNQRFKKNFFTFWVYFFLTSLMTLVNDKGGNNDHPHHHGDGCNDYVDLFTMIMLIFL